MGSRNARVKKEAGRSGAPRTTLHLTPTFEQSQGGSQQERIAGDDPPPHAHLHETAWERSLGGEPEASPTHHHHHHLPSSRPRRPQATLYQRHFSTRTAASPHTCTCTTTRPPPTTDRGDKTQALGPRETTAPTPAPPGRGIKVQGYPCPEGLGVGAREARHHVVGKGDGQ